MKLYATKNNVKIKDSKNIYKFFEKVNSDKYKNIYYYLPETI